VTTLSDIQVLVSAGSKHGASAEIADSIGETLAGRGFDVTVAKPEEVTDVAGYQAVVLGSAVYAGHWTDPAKDLAQRVAAADPKPAVWLFSSGPLGDPPKPEEDPVDVSEIVEATSARGHRVFSGKIDKSKLSFGEKAIMIAVRAPEGDFRDWDEINTWTESIADTLDTAG
jgi:menaquinone-dependent protoporphyrinogen oxidase